MTRLNFSADISAGISEDLIKKLAGIIVDGHPGSSDFSGTAVIFPNRRPAYYLVERISSKLRRPFAPPALFSINEFALAAARRIRPGASAPSFLDRLYLLFEAVKKNAGDHPPKDFGEFAAFGAGILETLDEMEMAALDYGKIKSVWSPEIPEKLHNLVARLPSIKNDFDAGLASRGFLSRAGIFRLAASSLDPAVNFPDISEYFVCGFRDVTELEKRVLSKLSSGAARVSEISYEIPAAWNTEKIRLYSAHDTHSQTKKVAEILAAGFDPGSTAVIIPRPDALVPLLSEAVERFDVEYNVSVGYPLSRTPLAAFFTLILKLQESRTSDGYRLDEYRRLLSHPYTREIFFAGVLPAAIAAEDRISAAFSKPFAFPSEIETAAAAAAPPGLVAFHKKMLSAFETTATLGELSEKFLEITTALVAGTHARSHPFSGEFFEKFRELLEQMKTSLAAAAPMPVNSLYDIYARCVSSDTLPFPGVPLKGLQILGLLEARNIKFKKIIILDVNEGVVPGVDRFDPVFPAALKKILGLPTYKDREKIFRANFMTLVNSADEAHLIYRVGGRDSRSRFIEEIIWERERLSGKVADDAEGVEPVCIGGGVSPGKTVEIPKSARCLDTLGRMRFSPSAIDRYLNCPASFYFHSVLGLREQNEFTGEADAARIGECIHAALKIFFDRHPAKADLADAKAQEELSVTVEKTVAAVFGPIRGETYLVCEVMKNRLAKALDFERSRPGDFLVSSTEKTLSSRLEYAPGKTISVEGRIDRTDMRDAAPWLIDYKTGGYRMPLSDLEELPTSRAAMKKKIKSFQLPIYAWLYASCDPAGRYPRAAYFSLKDIRERELFGKRDPKGVSETIFLPSLRRLVSEIFDPAVPFVADDEGGGCEYCPYGGMCGG